MDKNATWSLEYDNTGGYDCMTPAYILKHGEQEVCAIDEKDFRRFCGQGYEADHAKREPIKLTKEYADYIFQAVNSHEALVLALKQIMTTSSTIIEAVPSVKNSLMIDYRHAQFEARRILGLDKAG